VEARHPDVAFIMTGYDNENYTTTVHPDYYSKILSEQTDLLVYIPYYVTSSSWYNTTMDDMICITGVVYSHLTILQSEEIRQIYIRVLKNWEIESNTPGMLGDLESRILALGSPKFDKVINTKREDCVLPAEWQEKVKGKKIILYNTTIGAILAKNEANLRKIQSTINSFKARDDAVLWWRPHPLSLATYETMRPFLLDEYKKTVEEYRADDFGIYDDTQNLHRAIAWSDAYYGDWSSLVMMYQVTGKPVMIQRILPEPEERHGMEPLCFTDLTVDENGVAWAFEVIHDGLFKLDFENNTAELAANSANMPQRLGKKSSTVRYMKIEAFGSKLLCFPYFLNDFFVYDLSTDEKTHVPLDPEYLIQDADGFVFTRVSTYKGKYYCFSSYVKAIVVFNAETNAVEYHTELFDKVGLYRKNGIHIKVPLYISEPDENGHVKILLADNGEIFDYCLESQSWEVTACNDDIIGRTMADYDGSYIWFFKLEDMRLLRWDVSTNELNEYPLDLDAFHVPEDSVKLSIFSGMVGCGDYLLLFPSYANKIVRFEKKSGSFSQYTDMSMPGVDDTATYKYDRPKKIGNIVYAFSRYNSTVYKLDITNGAVTTHKFAIDLACDNKTINCLRYHMETENASPDGDAGEKIYQHVKETCGL
jgi:hypothetical protein